MGWPPRQPDGLSPQPVAEEVDGPQRGGFVVRIRTFCPSLATSLKLLIKDRSLIFCATVTPMLHLIDLGSMTEDDLQDAIAENIYTMGCVRTFVYCASPLTYN